MLTKSFFICIYKSISYIDFIWKKVLCIGFLNYKVYIFIKISEFLFWIHQLVILDKDFVKYFIFREISRDVNKNKNINTEGPESFVYLLTLGYPSTFSVTWGPITYRWLRSLNSIYKHFLFIGHNSRMIHGTLCTKRK